MAETFPCPKCGKRLALLAKQAGKKGRCQACGTVFVVPSPASRESQLPSSPPESPLTSPPAAVTPGDRPVEETAEPERQEISLRGLGVGAFVASHRLMLAVVAVALAVSVGISVAGQPVLGIVLALAGFGIAPFGMMAAPAPHKSSSGKIFAAVAGILLLNLIVLGAVFGYIQAPARESTAIRAVYYLGLMALLGMVVVVIALGSWLMSRFGFFRPAAWGYVGLAPCVVIAVLVLSGSPAPVAVAPPPPVKVASPAPSPAPAPAPVVVAPPPAPSIDPAQLQQMLEQVQVMAELSQATQRMASDPQGALDDLDRLAKKQSQAAMLPAAPGANAPAAAPPTAGASPAPGAVSLEKKLSGMVAGLNELADTLAAIRDESGARDALGKVREIMGRVATLVNAPTSLDPKDVVGLKADVLAGHTARHDAALQRVRGEVVRIKPIPGTQEVVAETDRFLGQLGAASPKR